MEVLKEMKKLHVKTGDTVEVISGKDKGCLLYTSRCV